MDVVTMEYVRDRLGLPDDADLNAKIQRAISSATPYLESVCGSEFSEADRQDIFYIDPAAEVCVSGVYVLRTASGFIRGGVTLHVGRSIELVQSTALDAPGITPLRVDSVHGFVWVPESMESQYIRASYTSGFETSSDPTIPGWLREAGFYQTVAALSSEQIGDEKPGLDQVYAYLQEQQRLMLDVHRRSRHHSIAPLL